MKLVIVAGGDNAAAMLGRMMREAQPVDSVQLPGMSIAASNVSFVRCGEDLFLTIGTPIGRVWDPSEAPLAPGIGHDPKWVAERFAEQDGSFVSVHWSGQQRKLTIVTDFLGFKPLYIRRTRGRLELANETKAWNAAPDPAGWGSFISFGHTIASRTLLNGVARVGPALILTYDLASDRLDEHCYWRWPAPVAQPPDLGALVAAIDASIGLYANRGSAATLLLSGGFDSRLIACLLARRGIPAHALSVEHAEELFDADSRFAERIAHRLALPFQRVRSAPDFYSSTTYLDYLYDSDASTQSLFLFIARVAQFVGHTPVWEGVIPGYTLTTPHQGPGGFDAYLNRECAGPESNAWLAARQVFHPEFVAALQAEFHADLQEEVQCYSDDGHGVSEFILRNRARNRTSINPTKVYECRVSSFLPGMTRDYFDLAGTLSFEARCQNRLYIDLFRNYVPEALEHPILSGGNVARLSGWSPYHHVGKVAKRCLQLASEYPRVTRMALPRSWQPSQPHSRFLSASTLLEEPDPCIDQDSISAALRHDRFSEKAAKLLFHWTAWRRLHEGRLHESFTETSAAAMS